MILDDDCDVLGRENVLGAATINNVPLHGAMSFEQLTTHTEEIENEDTHYGLRGDLIEHLWALKGANMYV